MKSFWDKRTCTCREFLSRLMCVHILGLGIIDKEVPVDKKYRMDGEKIHMKPKRGAPKKAGRCLQREEN